VPFDNVYTAKEGLAVRIVNSTQPVIIGNKGSYWTEIKSN
jgi:hypothetical protein